VLMIDHDLDISQSSFVRDFVRKEICDEVDSLVSSQLSQEDARKKLVELVRLCRADLVRGQSALMAE